MRLPFASRRVGAADVEMLARRISGARPGVQRCADGAAQVETYAQPCSVPA